MLTRTWWRLGAVGCHDCMTARGINSRTGRQPRARVLRAAAWLRSHRAVCAGGTVDFSDAKVSGGHVDFSGVEFSGAAVDFTDAEFSGGRVGFFAAELSGGRVGFGGAKVSGGTVDFFSGTFFGSPNVDMSSPVDWSVPPRGVVGSEPRLQWPSSEHLAQLESRRPENGAVPCAHDGAERRAASGGHGRAACLARSGRDRRGPRR